MEMAAGVGEELVGEEEVWVDMVAETDGDRGQLMWFLYVVCVRKSTFSDTSRSNSFAARKLSLWYGVMSSLITSLLLPYK